jgi:hypothetical protein
MFEFHKKEKPFLGIAGLGGGVVSRLLDKGVSFNATGGTIYTPGDGYTYHVFTSPGSFDVSDTSTGDIQYINIGGGGGGGGAGPLPSDAGGGGAGGYTLSDITVTGPFTAPITIGGGGAGGPFPISNGSPGSDTTIAFPAPNGGTITGGYGGGGGGAPPSATGPDAGAGQPAPLGSGGGAGQLGYNAGTGGPQGNPGRAPSGSFDAGGGGGAGGVGGAVGAFRNGGLGIQLPVPYRNIPGIGFPGSSGTHWFAGGGGGADDGTAAGSPSLPVRWSGAGAADPGVRNADTNSGSGGGGGGTAPNPGGNGGSGIVIIRYPI